MLDVGGFLSRQLAESKCDNLRLECNHIIDCPPVTLGQLLRLSDPIIAILNEESGDMVAVHGRCLVGPGIVKESHVHLTASATRICRYESCLAMPRPSRARGFLVAMPQRFSRELLIIAKIPSSEVTLTIRRTPTTTPSPLSKWTPVFLTRSYVRHPPPAGYHRGRSEQRSRIKAESLALLGRLASDPRGSWTLEI